MKSHYGTPPKTGQLHHVYAEHHPVDPTYLHHVHAAGKTLRRSFDDFEPVPRTPSPTRLNSAVVRKHTSTLNTTPSTLPTSTTSRRLERPCNVMLERSLD
ncbi:hypothetical protein GALMADRAFT_796309 [Galerina marginata CBS 339.88]|uniref:Uncharacterized protein n=1 Tax=Galerina marginata (strain CBS 339.88) TaxID=685588 RepID=A0A067SU54_GALM3|nr:hypothetical protein GALMADRAFT_796309 [Galerina marginata CBS 339.88]